jgi:LacI family transcriptional regulator
LAVTLSHIADHTGVDASAVSRVLGGKARQYRISHTTERRVLRAADELGYRPNASARATRQGCFGSIALILSTHTGRSDLPPDVLAGISSALDASELHLTLARLPDDKLTDAGYVPRILRELSCDGMLIDYTDHIPERMIDLIDDTGQPAVWLNRKREHDCVYPDDLAIGRRATERLLEAGHRRIAYVDWGAGWKQLDQAHYSQRDRQAGYERAMADAGLAARVIRRDDSDVVEPLTALHQAMVNLLSRDDRPTAFVTYSRVFAQVIAGAASVCGLSVPRDLSLVTVSYQADVTGAGLEIACVMTPGRSYGSAGVKCLLKKIARPATRLAPRPIAPKQFFEGQTIAPPGAGPR